MKKLFKYSVFFSIPVFMLLWSCEKDESFQQIRIPGQETIADTQKELLSIGEGLKNLYQQTDFKRFLYNEVESRFDGDYNVLIDKISKSYPENESLKSGHTEQAIRFFNEKKSFPQVYIPFYEKLKSEDKLNKSDPVIVIYTDEIETGEYPGYQFDKNGNLTRLNFLIDENYAQNNEVWVISVNERVDGAGNVAYCKPDLSSVNRLIHLANTAEDLLNENLKSALACTSPPSTPQNVQVYPLLPYSLNIQWQELQTSAFYKIYRETDYSANYVEIATVPFPNSSYSDNGLNIGTHYDYKIRAYNGDDCYSATSYGVGAKASWRTQDYNEILYQIYITDVCWSWCCGWPEGDIELVYRLVKYNKLDQMTEYPKNALPQKSKSSQKGKYCTYNEELFRWDVKKYAYNYMMFFYEDDGGDDNGCTIKLSIKFQPTDKASISADVAFTIDNKDEQLGWIEIYHSDPYLKQYSLNPEKGGAKVIVKQ
jgi:hypothetical protein